MFKKLLFITLISSVLGACSQQQEIGQDSNSGQKPAITLEEAEISIKEHGLELKGANLPEQNVFIQELNGVIPTVYLLEGTTLSIYVFQSNDNREEGMEAFEEVTATAKLEPYQTLTVQNLLIFHVEGNEKINNKLITAIEQLGRQQECEKCT